MTLGPAQAHPPTHGAELVLGGARSGKSAYALAQAMTFGNAVTWIATAEAFDDDMRQRIVRHRAERPSAWQTIEEPRALATALARAAAPDRCTVVDCLTLWLSNWLCVSEEGTWQRERDTLLAALPRLPGRILLVSNEVGSGIVPDNALARRFRDEAGWLHQAIARLCPAVTLVVAGIPMPVKRPDPDPR